MIVNSFGDSPPYERAKIHMVCQCDFLPLAIHRLIETNIGDGYHSDWSFTH